MTVRNIKKNLAGAEDLLHGIGVETQSRGGAFYEMHKLDTYVPTYDVTEMQRSSLTFMRLYGTDTAYTDYRRNPTGTIGIPSELGGVWEPIRSSELPVCGSFIYGAYVFSSDCIVGYNDSFMQWQGDTPKEVAAGATPATSGGIGAGTWVDRTDVTLRSDLNVVVRTFDSVADMKADETLLVNQKCRTLGYYAVGDGGGNDYTIVAAATGTDDGGSYIDLSGSGFQAKGLFGTSVNVKQFGAVGDKTTDDSQSINNMIAYAHSSGNKRLLFFRNHFITNVNMTNLFDAGIIIESISINHQDDVGVNDDCTFFVSGSSSVGIDVSGTTGCIFRDITIHGDDLLVPKSGMLMSRTTVNGSAGSHHLYDVKFRGSFQYSGHYNFGAESNRYKNCTFLNNIYDGCTITSKKNAGISTAFATEIATSIHPMTDSSFDGCQFFNNWTGVSNSSYGIRIEKPGTGDDIALFAVSFLQCYSNGKGIASYGLINVDGNVSWLGCDDESYATGDANGNAAVIKVINKSSGSTNNTEQLFLSGFKFLGGRNYIIDSTSGDCNGVEIIACSSLGSAEGGGVRHSEFRNLNASYIHWVNSMGTITVNGGSRNTINPENTATFDLIDLSNSANLAQYSNRSKGTPSFASITPPYAGVMVSDVWHDRLYISDANLNYKEIITARQGSSVPSSGNYQVGQIVSIKTFPDIVSGGKIGWVCSNTGTAGTLTGVTGSITSGSDQLTVNTTSGIKEGNYISIVGVSGRKQVISISGLTLTISSVANATVSGSAVTYYPASFLEFGQIF